MQASSARVRKFIATPASRPRVHDATAWQSPGGAPKARWGARPPEEAWRPHGRSIWPPSRVGRYCWGRALESVLQVQQGHAAHEHGDGHQGQDGAGGDAPDGVPGWPGGFGRDLGGQGSAHQLDFAGGTVAPEVVAGLAAWAGQGLGGSARQIGAVGLVAPGSGGPVALPLQAVLHLLLCLRDLLGEGLGACLVAKTHGDLLVWPGAPVAARSIPRDGSYSSTTAWNISAIMAWPVALGWMQVRSNHSSASAPR